jgi:hypothetical protein
MLGLLGGRYVFQEWVGFVNTKENPVNIIVSGGERTLTMKAVYAQDLTIPYVVAGITLGAVALVALIIVKRRRRPASSPSHKH